MKLRHPIARKLTLTLTLVISTLWGTPTLAASEGRSTDEHPNRVRMREMLAELDSDDGPLPAPLVRTIAATMPSTVLNRLIPGPYGAAELEYDFAMSFALSLSPRDSTAENWCLYAGDGLNGYLAVFHREGEHVWRTAQETWQWENRDSVVRVAPPIVTIYPGGEFGMPGYLITIDGLVDVAGNLCDEIFHWSTVKLDRLTKLVSPHKRRQQKIVQTEVRFEDVDGDGFREISLFRVNPSAGQSGSGFKMLPMKIYKYEPVRHKFIETAIPRTSILLQR
jgi:hypothetical protein